MDVLGAFREEPLPPSGVDVARAVRTGRRWRRVRAGVAAGAALAIVATVVLLAPQWRSFLPGGSSRASNIGSTSSALACFPRAPLSDLEPPTTVDGAPTGFDVLSRIVTADAATGLVVEHYATSRLWQRLELTSPDGAHRAEIIVTARAVTPVFASRDSRSPVPVDPTTGTRTDPVGGATAYWLPGQQTLYQYDVARLGWQWAPGAWAFVAVADTSSDHANGTEQPRTTVQIDQLRALARQVASGLNIGTAHPVTSPFTMPVPDCTRLVGTDLLTSTAGNGTPFTRLALSFAPESYELGSTPLLNRPGPGVDVTADSYETPADKPGSASGDVDGHPAVINGDALIVHGVNGFAFEVNAPGGQAATVALYRTIRVVPGAGALGTAWTSQPIAH